MFSTVEITTYRFNLQSRSHWSQNFAPLSVLASRPRGAKKGTCERCVRIPGRARGVSSCRGMRTICPILPRPCTTGSSLRDHEIWQIRAESDVEICNLVICFDLFCIADLVSFLNSVRGPSASPRLTRPRRAPRRPRRSSSVLFRCSMPHAAGLWTRCPADLENR